MNIEQIEQMWTEDSKIDQTNLTQSSAVTFELHSKYYKLLNQARRKLAALEGKKSTLTVLKAEYYWGQSDYETLKMYGWKQFTKKLTNKSELPAYINGDQDIIDLNIEIAECKTTIDFIESIIKSIHSRSFVIGNILEDRKFLNGGY